MLLKATVDSETNRIFVGDSILNGTLPKETYLKLLNSKFAVKDCIKIMMLIAKCALRKMNVKLTETLLEAEAWRVMIRTSQKLFPAKMRKGFPEKMVHNIRVVQFRLDPQKMREHYDTRYLPILGKGDPLAIKMTRDNHVEKSLLQDIHLPVRTTVRNLARGKFGILFLDARKCLNQIVSTCVRCCEQAQYSYDQALGNIYVKLNTFNHPFESISLDPLGHMEVKAFNNSRKVVKLYPLLIRCIDTGAVNCLLMESM